MDKKELIYNLIQILKSEVITSINRYHVWYGEYDDIKTSLSLIQGLEREHRNIVEKEFKDEKKSS